MTRDAQSERRTFGSDWVPKILTTELSYTPLKLLCCFSQLSKLGAAGSQKAPGKLGRFCLGMQ